MKARCEKQEGLAFGRGLQTLIEREEVTYTEVAEWSGLDRQTVSEICRSSRQPHESTKRRIAAVFRMSVEEVEVIGWSSEAAICSGNQQSACNHH